MEPVVQRSPISELLTSTSRFGRVQSCVAVASTIALGATVALRHSVLVIPVALVAMFGILITGSGSGWKGSAGVYVPVVSVASAAVASFAIARTIPLAIVVPIAAAFVAGASRFGVDAHLDSRGMFSWGRVTPLGIVLAVSFGFVGAVVLAAYLRSVGFGVPVIPSMNRWLLRAGVVGFGLLNSVAEELVWRGSLVDVLEERGFRCGAVGAVTSISFGIAHFYGVPSGAVGVLLASVFGAGMYVLRRISGGLLTPIIGHLVVDVATAVMIF